MVSIDAVIDEEDPRRSTRHESQFYEWLPWVDGSLDRSRRSRPSGWRGCASSGAGKPIARRPSARRCASGTAPKGDGVKDAEAFEVCEYGRRPSEAELRRLFPFFD